MLAVSVAPGTSGSNAEANCLVNFIVKPRTIPAITIQRLHTYAISSGRLNDIWECDCSISTLTITRRVAVKAFRIPDDSHKGLLEKAGQRIRREAHIRIQLSHDNILPLEGVTEGFGLLPALVAPWMQNGSLDEYLNDIVLSRDRKLHMLSEVAAGLHYLHDKGIVHGNLTPGNILVSGDGKLYIGGFGLSTILAESENPTFESRDADDARWMAPEILHVPEHEGVVKPIRAADVYSYGCIMIQLFSGRLPYCWLKQGLLVIPARCTGTEPFREFTGTYKNVEEFAKRCLSSSSEHRPSVTGITEFLSLQINIMKATKVLMSKRTVTEISEAVLTKSDDHANDLGILAAPLKYNWSHESSVIEVAVKTLSDDINSINDMNKACTRICREMYVREKVRHEGILAIYGMTTGFGILPSFVYPWMTGGCLHAYVKRESRLSALQRLDILCEILDAIKYLHNRGIAHGNLTGDNVFINRSGRVRIADFSHSVILVEADDVIFKEQLLGDVRYIAPECIVHAEPQKPTKARDVYSFGCIAILVLSGQIPYWWISEESDVLTEKAKGTEPFSLTTEIDEKHLNLVRQCLSAETSRPPIEKILYLILVQRFGTSDLTNAVERYNKGPQATGGYANVHSCRLHLTDATVLSGSTLLHIAVKEIRPMNDVSMLRIIQRLSREITLWSKLKHENIVPLLGVADGFSSVPALVSPWLENGPLTDYLRHNHKILFCSQKFALLRDVARGLQYLHEQDIVHGDLSGNNVLVDKDGRASLIDFGLSALVPERISRALLPSNPGGTARWMAPEQLAHDEGNVSPKFSPKSDVYSFGRIMLQVLEGKVPYHYIQRYPTIISYLLKGKLPVKPHRSLVSDSDWDFIQRCWSDMEHRPSGADILAFVEGRVGE